MANTTISPNMLLPVPVPSVDPGPDWATNIVACLNAVDSHNHTTGQGVPITPQGINVNTDLPLNNNNMISARSLRFLSQGAPLSLGTDLGCLYESGVDLYFNDGSGNQIRITQSGSVAGSAGTITGLPSGTASASFAGGIFTFQSATNTPATMAVGPLVIGANAVSPKTVTIGPNGSQAANYVMTLPLALPSSQSAIVSDNAGNQSFIGLTSSSFSPTFSFNYGSGSALTITTNSSTWYYTRINNIVTVFGKIVFSYTGTGSGTSTYTASSTIPVATSSLTSAGSYVISGTTLTNSSNYELNDSSNTSVITSSILLPAAITQTNRVISFSYSYQIS